MTMDSGISEKEIKLIRQTIKVLLSTSAAPLQMMKQVFDIFLKIPLMLSEQIGEKLAIGSFAPTALWFRGLFYLGKLFRINTGISFKEYLNQMRINQAEILLSTGGYSVTEVAERCGFHDISYFSNVFKSIKGCPPSSVCK
ncbi:helix-turn-helix transcriptional regulator [Paenibacillus silviterrae]|uniref:helix-turn-helix transcriptional regulator n=1 Tax=Paenibacillus silviterrae TaxID=3242194 RepID=UPI0035566E2F